MIGTTRSPRLAAVVGVLAILTAVAGPAVASTRAVHVGSFYFEDATRGDGRVVVTQGDRISFAFEGKAQHSATVDGLFSSGTKSPGARWTSPLLTRVGTYTLYCQVHGAPRHGTALVVQRRPAPSPSPTRKPPSAAPTKTAAPPSSAPSPSVSPTTSPTATPTPAPSPSPVARPTSARPTPSASPSDSPSTAVAADTPDVEPAGPLDDSGSGWLLPGSLLGLVLLGAAAIALGRRRRQH
jgi:plastocyanin